ncbi:hypothetical protein LUA82_04255 [Neoehrlichia mikurensis]|nr:hypothetical protein [Neoehrlichia mikurensis]UTO55363.1 hypothetical protein LUA82_04255 [Neoehrlichia mikurensis]
MNTNLDKVAQSKVEYIIENLNPNENANLVINNLYTFSTVAGHAAKTAYIYNLAKILNNNCYPSKAFSISESHIVSSMNSNIQYSIIRILYSERFFQMIKQAVTTASIYNLYKNLTIKKAKKLATGEYYRRQFSTIAQKAATTSSIYNIMKDFNSNAAFISIRHASKIAHMSSKAQMLVLNDIIKHFIEKKFLFILYNNLRFLNFFSNQLYINNSNLINFREDITKHLITISIIQNRCLRSSIYSNSLPSNSAAIENIINNALKQDYKKIFSKVAKEAAVAALIYNSSQILGNKLSIKIKEVAKFAAMESNIPRPLIDHNFLDDVAEHHYNKPRIARNKLLKEASHKLFSQLKLFFIQLEENDVFAIINSNTRYVIMVGILIDVIAKQHNYNKIISQRFKKDVANIISSKFDNVHISDSHQQKLYL